MHSCWHVSQFMVLEIDVQTLYRAPYSMEMQFPKEISAKAIHYGLLEMNVLDGLQGIFVKEFRFWR